jgi:ribonuclease HI
MSSDFELLIGDGACKGNPGPGGWGLIYVSGGKVYESGGAKASTTNNEMELQAFCEGLSLAKASASQAELKLYWDSKYVLSGASAWVYGWAKKGWKNKEGEDVKNRELWKEILSLLLDLKKTRELSFYYVPGHSGFPGNERVDAIASSLAEGNAVDFYLGSLPNYFISYDSGLDSIEPFQYQSNFQSKSNSKAKAYYISYVGGQIYRDDSWAQCEARVKGTSGAKYKKVKSEAEEKEALKKWGL